MAVLTTAAKKAASVLLSKAAENLVESDDENKAAALVITIFMAVLLVIAVPTTVIAGAVGAASEYDQRQTVEDYADDDWGTDYGEIRFLDVVYYNQTDSRWGNKKYGSSGSIAKEGCGPTSVAMVVATMVDPTVTPLDVAIWSAANGYRCVGNGSYHSLIPAAGEHYGLTVTGIGAVERKLVNALKQGKMVIALMGKGHFTSKGHFIVLYGITDEGKVLVADPASYKRSQQEWDLQIIIDECKKGAGAGGPFWVFS